MLALCHHLPSLDRLFIVILDYNARTGPIVSGVEYRCAGFLLSVSICSQGLPVDTGLLQLQQIYPTDVCGGVHAGRQAVANG